MSKREPCLLFIEDGDFWKILGWRGGGGRGGGGERCQDFLVKMGGVGGGIIVIGGVYRRGISTALVGNVWIL